MGKFRFKVGDVVYNKGQKKVGIVDVVADDVMRVKEESTKSTVFWKIKSCYYFYIQNNYRIEFGTHFYYGQFVTKSRPQLLKGEIQIGDEKI